MSVSFNSTALPLSKEEIDHVWHETCQLLDIPDADVAVRIVSKQEIQKLNQQYRQKDKPTNVLTFTYPAEIHLPESITQHDIVVCLEVAEEEAGERDMAVRDYVAWLLTHAFLHAAGVDHEQSPQEEEKMREYEHQILQRSGFSRPPVY